MKGKVLVALLLFLSGTIFGKVSLENLTWIRIGGSFNSNLALVGGGNFTIPRSYFTFKADISDKISARVTLDMAKSKDSTVDAYFKYAFANFKIDQAFNIGAGMFLTHFGYQAQWTYWLPVLSIIDQGGLNSSADLGIQIFGEVSILKYWIQLVNGEGYGTWNVGDNPNLAAIASVELNFVKDVFKMGLSYKFPGADSAIAHAFDVYADFKIKPLWVLVDFAGKLDYANVFTPYLQGVVGVDLGNVASLYAMVHMKNTDLAFNFGANIKPIKGVAIKPMLGYDIAASEFSVLAELEFAMGVTIP